MSPSDEQITRELFGEAIELPQSEWPGFLDRCSATPEIRRRLEALLDHHVKSVDFLSRPASATFPVIASPFKGRLAEFRVIRELGRGGMGIVYLAEDTVLRRAVALKVLGPISGDEILLVEQFQREAQAVARLGHPGIVQVFRTGRDGEFAYIAMEFVEGTTLRERLAKRIEQIASPPSRKDDVGGDPDLIEVIAEVAEALEHAHRKGVVHRDVKPSNILIDKENKAHLTDFGIARMTSEATLSTAGQVAGSFPYMSPEQLQVESSVIDGRSDVFSLGVVLYETLTKKRPFDGASPQDVLRALLHTEAVPVQKLNPHAPRDLCVICHKAIEKSVPNRYQSATHMAADLRAFLAGNPILAVPPGPWRRLKARMRSHSHLLSVAGIILVLMVAAAATIAWQKAANASRVWLYIEPHEGVHYSLRRVPMAEDQIQRDDPEESVPSGLKRLPPGAYCLVARRNVDGAECEFNLALLQTGKESQTRVMIVGADERFPLPLPAGTKVGVLRETRAATVGMIRVPAGEYRLDRPANAEPILRGVASLDSFWIDATEVSNREYREFIDATGYPPPARWAGGDYSDAIADRPVIWVTREDAEAYARWRGKRLPSVAEWQAAARGHDGRLYPWGDAAPPVATDTADTGESSSPFDIREGYIRSTVPVNQPNVGDRSSSFLHSFSNVREFTSTVHGPDRSACLVGRGWSDDPMHWTLADVLFTPLGVPAARGGFRCAKSVSQGDTQ